MIDSLRRFAAGLLRMLATGSSWLADRVHPEAGGGQGEEQ